MGVFVVGMHRSGTSALTRLITDLGLFPGDSSELMAATEDNAAGYFEVSTLTRQNDTLLDALGGSALAPPAVERDFCRSLSDFEEQSGELFDKTLGHRSWVWKDPRNCLLLPFWLRAIGGSHVAVMIFRSPTEVAASLVKRDPIGTRAALALWEFYVRQSLRSVRSMPLYVTSYEILLTDPVGVATDISGFFGRNGFEVVESVGGDFGVDVGLRHQEDTSREALSASQAELFDKLGSLIGEHSDFEVPDLGPMDELSLGLLEERCLAVGPIERAQHSAETRRVELERVLRDAAKELEHRQSVIEGLMVKLEATATHVLAVEAEAARWRSSVDHLAAECDRRDLQLSELERDLESALARIHVRANNS